jgi:hypothetical protein
LAPIGKADCHWSYGKWVDVLQDFSITISCGDTSDKGVQGLKWVRTRNKEETGNKNIGRGVIDHLVKAPIAQVPYLLNDREW